MLFSELLKTAPATEQVGVQGPQSNFEIEGVGGGGTVSDSILGAQDTFFY